MPKGRQQLRTGSFTVSIRHARTPCDKSYSGSHKKVNMLIKLHRKKCEVCRAYDLKDAIYQEVDTDQSRDNLGDVRQMMDDLVDKLYKEEKDNII